MITAGLNYINQFAVSNDLWEIIPFTDVIFTFSTISCYIIILLYIISLTGKIKKWHLMLFIPPFILSLMVAVAYLMTPPDHMTESIQAVIYNDIPLPECFWCELNTYFHLSVKIVRIIVNIFVLTLGYHRLANFQTMVRERFSNSENCDLHEIKNLFTIFVVTSSIAFFADLVGVAFYIDSCEPKLGVMTTFAVMLFLIGYNGNKQKFTIDDLRKEMYQDDISEEFDKKPLETAESQRDDLLIKINSLMEKDELYLKKDLKVSDLADLLGTNRTYIYNALKTDKEVLSFPSYVNSFRIRHSIELMKKDKNRLVFDIATESGFSNESTFYRVFKKECGVSPRQYMNNL